MVEGAKASSEFIFSQIEKVKNSREENKREEVRRARESLKQHLKDKSDILNPVEEKTAEDYVLPRNLVVGDRIIVVNLGQHGEVVSESDEQGNIAVRVGRAIMRTNIKNLMLDESKPQEKPKNYRNTGDYDPAIIKFGKRVIIDKVKATEIAQAQGITRTSKSKAV